MQKTFQRAVVCALTCSVAIGLTVAAWAATAPLSSDAADPDLLANELDRGSAGLARLLAELRTRASVLMVTAHPDDEDGGLLAYNARALGARGALMSLTRGEGGQNAITPDLYDALGVIRTQELLAADRYYGVEQYWGTEIDYGFSKTREEAIEKWGYDRVLGDVVRVIRLTRPLVVTSVWAGAPTDGHGNHQVAGQMAQEAFAAAGDPKRFPDQIREGLRPWTPLKMYARVPFFEATDKGIYDYATDKYVPVRFYDYINKKWIEGKPSADLSIPEGELQPVSGLTNAQIWRTGLGFEKTQNGGYTTPPASASSMNYHRYASHIAVAAHETSMYDGIDTSLQGISSLASGNAEFLREGLEKLSQVTQEAAARFVPGRPAAVAPALADGLGQVRKLIRQTEESQSLTEPGKQDVLFELNVKQEQFEKALALALGASFEAVTAPEKDASGPFAAFGGPAIVFQIAIPGQSFFVKAHVYNAGSEAIQISGVALIATDGTKWQIEPKSEMAASLASGKDLNVRFSVKVPEDAHYTRPYFTRPDEEQPYYDVRDPAYRNLSNAPYPLVASVRLRFHEVEFTLKKYVLSTERVEGMGPQAYPLWVGPAISVHVSPAAGAVPLNCGSFMFSCTLRSNVKKPASGTLHLDLPSGWTSTPAEYKFSSQREGDIQTVTFHVEPRNIKAEGYEIKAVAEYNGVRYEEGYRSLGYPGLRPYPLYRGATYKAVGIDVKTPPGLKVGYIPGTGDEVPRALESLGLNLSVLPVESLASANLAQYDALVLGVRAYSQPGVRAAEARLMDYVKNGGTLVAQYNTQDYDVDLGPYPLTLGSSPAKVVDETSAVSILQPDNGLLNWPNKITQADFASWQEERGHGFAQKWDQHYTSLVETHDPEQDNQSGGLLVARYGKGVFIYDAFALYRQVSAGVPGAFRILANLVSAGKNPAWN